MNYKRTVKEIEIIQQENKFVPTYLPTCHCSTSMFQDPVHKHVVTGDLRIITNSKLKKLLSKAPNFRKNKFINYDRCLTSVVTALDNNFTGKNNVPEESFHTWHSEIVKNVECKVNHLKSQKVSQTLKQVLKNPDVINYIKYMFSYLLTKLQIK